MIAHGITAHGELLLFFAKGSAFLTKLVIHMLLAKETTFQFVFELQCLII